MQTMLDDYLLSNGFTAIRANSIFCRSNPNEDTSRYGKVFIIFPVNGFSFTWSPVVFDLMQQYKDSDTSIENLHYTNKHFTEALNTENEIMIHGEYYAFSYDMFYQVLSSYLLNNT